MSTTTWPLGTTTKRSLTFKQKTVSSLSPPFVFAFLLPETDSVLKQELCYLIGIRYKEGTAGAERDDSDRRAVLVGWDYAQFGG